MNNIPNRILITLLVFLTVMFVLFGLIVLELGKITQEVNQIKDDAFQPVILNPNSKHLTRIYYRRVKDIDTLTVQIILRK